MLMHYAPGAWRQTTALSFVPLLRRNDISIRANNFDIRAILNALGS